MFKVEVSNDGLVSASISESTMHLLPRHAAECFSQLISRRRVVPHDIGLSSAHTQSTQVIHLRVAQATPRR